MKDKIFHQIVRYTYAQQAVNAMRTQEKHRILEVGAGAHGNLAEYLPNDDITFLDVNLPEEVLADSRFVIGDATNLLYEDGYFDFIIALDVIEHITVDKRADFIKNLNRVARIGVILSVPHYCEKAPFEEELLKSFYLLCGATPPIWIDEHIDCTLPTKEEIIKMIEAEGVDSGHILSFHGVKRELMLKMMIMEAVASIYQECLCFFDIVNSDYIHSILYHDIGWQEESSMKTYVIWAKDDSIDLAREQFCRSCDDAWKVIDRFEEKYSELMTWVLGCSNIFNEKGILKEIRLNEEEILKEIRKITGEKIKLNVILITYNQEKFIKQTLETILMQQTTFDYNIIVADDCSTDGTVSIIKQMEQQTEIPFIYLPNDHNLGIMQNYKRAFEFCDAEYIAVMEGDDLWTDKLRLQKHVDFLEEHSECSMTFNRFVVKNFEEGTVAVQPRFTGGEEVQYYKYISGHDLAYDNLIGNFSTCVYRSSALKALPEQMYSMKCYDWLTNIMVSKMGYIGCLIQPMSIYRVHSGGTWSGQSDRERNASIIEAIDLYDEYTNREFTMGFAAHKLRLKVQTQPERPSKIKELIKKIIRGCYRISIYLPPIFARIIKLIIPPAIMDILSDTCKEVKL